MARNVDVCGQQTTATTAKSIKALQKCFETEIQSRMSNNRKLDADDIVVAASALTAAAGDDDDDGCDVKAKSKPNRGHITFCGKNRRKK